MMVAPHAVNAIQIDEVETTVDKATVVEWWKRHDELVEEINEHWPDDLSVADVMADIRREL